MALALTDYFDKDHFHTLLQKIEEEYGKGMGGINEGQSLLLILYLAATLMIEAATRNNHFFHVQTPLAHHLIEVMSEYVSGDFFIFPGENHEDNTPYRLAVLADQIDEVSDSKQKLQMIVAIADILLLRHRQEQE